jgi:predicted nucleic acid-binding protein
VARDFLDTNVLVYAFTDDQRSAMAQDLLGRGCAISVQVLNEFTNVARRKLGWNWREIRDALSDIRIVCPSIVPMSLDVHTDAVGIAERHGFSIYDALIVASALRERCGTLWSEDLRDGMVVDGRLRISDPFRVP